VLKVVVAVRRRTGLSFAEFRTRWCDEHPEYFQRMPGVRCYTQNLALAGIGANGPSTKVTELWFDNKEAVRAAFA
jgi:uncharacterized protein (TIGR02118 family)